MSQSVINSYMSFPASIPLELYTELDRTTLTGTSSDVECSGFASKQYLLFLMRPVFGDTNSKDCKFGCGGGSIDTGSNYSENHAALGGTNSTSVNKDPPNITCLWSANQATNGFGVYHAVNNASEQKLIQGYANSPSSSGSGSINQRVNNVIKWNNTSDAIQSVKFFRPSYDLDADSELVVLGYNPDDTEVTSPFELLYEGSITNDDEISTGTFTGKKYLWIQYEGDADSNSPFFRAQFNGDTGTNYSDRNESNGGGVNTNTGKTSIPCGCQQGGGSSTNKEFANMWISNHADYDKVIICNAANGGNDGGGNSPDRTTYALKWANTSSQITSMKLYNGQSGDYSKAKLKIWGMD